MNNISKENLIDLTPYRHPASLIKALIEIQRRPASIHIGLLMNSREDAQWLAGRLQGQPLRVDEVESHEAGALLRLSRTGLNPNH